MAANYDDTILTPCVYDDVEFIEKTGTKALIYGNEIIPRDRIEMFKYPSDEINNRTAQILMQWKLNQETLVYYNRLGEATLFCKKHLQSTQSTHVVWRPCEDFSQALDMLAYIHNPIAQPTSGDGGRVGMYFHYRVDPHTIKFWTHSGVNLFQSRFDSDHNSTLSLCRVFTIGICSAFTQCRKLMSQHKVNVACPEIFFPPEKNHALSDKEQAEETTERSLKAALRFYKCSQRIWSKNPGNTEVTGVDDGSSVSKKPIALKSDELPTEKPNSSALIELEAANTSLATQIDDTGANPRTSQKRKPSEPESPKKKTQLQAN